MSSSSFSEDLSKNETVAKEVEKSTPIDNQEGWRPLRSIENSESDLENSLLKLSIESKISSNPRPSPASYSRLFSLATKIVEAGAPKEFVTRSTQTEAASYVLKNKICETNICLDVAVEDDDDEEVMKELDKYLAK